MSGNSNVAKGRIKEAAGILTNNDKLRRQGKADQTLGKAEQAVDKTAKAIKNAIKNSNP